jgi:peptidoglycan/xylan/chitin deacetylase (PgdA/CDA1 family)
MKQSSWEKIHRHHAAKFLLTFFIFCCCSAPPSAPKEKEQPISRSTQIDSNTQPAANALEILQKKEVPILCYHQLRDYKPTDSKTARDYIVPPAVFSQQLKMLADSGYHTILPDQLMDYLLLGKSLPDKPFMLTFDDTDLEQFTVGATEMGKYGFKGVFFIMTVSLNKPRYMGEGQVRSLSDNGHVIASHTWDHHRVTRYTEQDWEVQVNQPSKQLEKLTGKPIRYFAYPFGLWDTAAVGEIKGRNFKAAFQLSAKRDSAEPLHTIRRIIVPGTLSGPRLLNRMRSAFH